MPANAMHALPRLSVHRFSLDRLDDAVQDPSFRTLLDQGWRPVITWAVEDERGRGLIPPVLVVVMAPPIPAPPVVVTAPTVDPTPGEKLIRVATPFLLAGILVTLLAMLVQG